MKNSIAKRVGIVGVLLLTLAVLAGCTAQAPQATAIPAATAEVTATSTAVVATTAVTATPVTATTKPAAALTAAPTATPTAALPTFNATDLAKYNGQNGASAYVAVDGKVYDVTNIPEWKNGSHWGRYQAGVDLSDAIKLSPHGISKLDSVPIVGIYQP